MPGCEAAGPQRNPRIGVMDKTSCDAAVMDLQGGKDEWAQLGLPARRKYLAGIRKRTAGAAEEMVAAAARAKHIPRGPLESEDWAGGPYAILRYARMLDLTLSGLESRGRPPISDGTARTMGSGRLAVRVFPSGLFDRFLYAGFSGEVRMREGVTGENLDQSMARFYRMKPGTGSVTLVLAAGNVAGIGPLDTLTRLYVDGSACLLKLNPVNEYLSPYIEAIFGELIRDGFVRIIRGGAEEGKYLCSHPGIDAIHITGSHLTHNAIVFGVGEEGVRRRILCQRQVTKPITSELGNVSPVIVVPGPWSRSDLKFHADNIAAQMVNNCGFNCCAAKVLILPQGWEAGRLLMEELKAILAAIPQRFSYYPGAEERYERFVGRAAKYDTSGERSPGILPWTIIPDLPANETGSLFFAEESFCGLMAQTSLPCSDPADYLRQAVDFCNNTLWGTLSACILVHPETEKELAGEMEKALAGLRYGSIGINHWPVLSFVLGTTTWGAYPGHSLQDIQSGIGVVHNSLMFDEPEKTIIRGPFRTWPAPPWFASSRNSHQVFRRLVKMEADPSLRTFLGVLSAAVLAL
jgi:hypothetical protein